MPELTQRMDRLERAIMEFVYIQHKTEMEIQSLKKEMKEFKDAIQKDKENLKREMKEFKDEIKKFKGKMKEFKDEMRREVKRMNKQWGELANKMGTIVEDIVFPATRPVLKKYFKCDPETLMMSVEKKIDGNREEWDVIAVCEDKIFLIEVKSSPRNEYVEKIKEKANRLLYFFQEHEGKEVIPILASLSIQREFLEKLTEEKIYGMAYREWEYMDILNFEEVDWANG